MTTDILKYDMAGLSAGIHGLAVLKPEIFEDARGYFFESFSISDIRKHGLVERTVFTPSGPVDRMLEEFVQDNESCSKAGTLRGLHWQAAPYEQAKLVRVVKGAVVDVALDIRPGSPTFGKWQAVTLTEENKLQFYIPCGFAHGFIALRDTVFQYKCSAPYCKAAERGIKYDDEIAAVKWPFELLIDGTALEISERDKSHPPFMATDEWKQHMKSKSEG